MNKLGLSDVHFEIATAVAGGKDWIPAGREIAGYSDSYCKVLRSRLLKKPDVRQMIDEIRKQGRAAAAYDLSRAMQEALEVIEFAKGTKNAMAYFKAVEHRAKLSGLLVDQLHVKAEVIDLAGALEAATRRVLDIKPCGYLPVPTVNEAQTSHLPLDDVLGD